MRNVPLCWSQKQIEQPLFRVVQAVTFPINGPFNTMDSGRLRMSVLLRRIGLSTQTLQPQQEMRLFEKLPPALTCASDLQNPHFDLFRYLLEERNQGRGFSTSYLAAIRATLHSHSATYLAATKMGASKLTIWKPPAHRRRQKMPSRANTPVAPFTKGPGETWTDRPKVWIRVVVPTMEACCSDSPSMKMIVTTATDDIDMRSGEYSREESLGPKPNNYVTWKQNGPVLRCATSQLHHLRGVESLKTHWKEPREWQAVQLAAHSSDFSSIGRLIEATSTTAVVTAQRNSTDQAGSPCVESVAAPQTTTNAEIVEQDLQFDT